MDTNETTSTDTVILDDEFAPDTETIGFGKELTKTLAISTATSAGVFGGFVVIALLTPKVKELWARRKSNVIDGEVTATSTENTTKKD